MSDKESWYADLLRARDEKRAESEAEFRRKIGLRSGDLEERKEAYGEILENASRLIGERDRDKEATDGRTADDELNKYRSLADMARELREQEN